MIISRLSVSHSSLTSWFCISVPPGDSASAFFKFSLSLCMDSKIDVHLLVVESVQVFACLFGPCSSCMGTCKLVKWHYYQDLSHPESHTISCSCVIHPMHLVSLSFRQNPLQPGARCMKLLVDSQLKLTQKYAFAFFSSDLWSLKFARLCYINLRHCGNVRSTSFPPRQLMLRCPETSAHILSLVPAPSLIRSGGK